MILSTESLDLIIRTLAKRLFTDKNPSIRIKAAQSLAKLATEKAIPALCQALEIEANLADLNVSFAIMDAIILISDLESSNLMSETPKYDLRGANIANFADTVQGDQKAVQHNYAAPQNLTEAHFHDKVYGVAGNVEGNLQVNPDPATIEEEKNSNS